MTICMQWGPLGQIFKCDEHLPDQFVSHAQSAQVLPFDNFLRVYFSTRQRDPDGKFKSHIAYADFDKDMQAINKVSDHQIIPLGELGTFDEHGIFPFSPFRDGDRLTAYTCGWSRRVSVSVETATGFAESFDDGKTFVKNGNGPIFGATLHEPMLVGDSFVRRYNDLYHMWYMVGTKWVREYDKANPDRIYKIAHATSSDGLRWEPDNSLIIPDKLHAHECQALPSVLYYNGIYHMVFCYRDVFGFRDDPSKGYRVGYAYSVDLKHWVRDDDLGNVSVQGEWDSNMMAYPHLFQNDGEVYCLYNGNNFGRDGFGALKLDNAAIQWGHNQSKTLDIKDHLKECGDEFFNELSIRVNIDEYTHKLENKAHRIELWQERKLIGLLAYYKNEDDKTIFITHVGVIKVEAQKGLGGELIARCLKTCGAKIIRLDVKADNLKALKLYSKIGFQVMAENNDYKTMELML